VSLWFELVYSAGESRSILKLYQVVVAMFGAQHGSNLPQVGSIALLLHTAGKRHGDDPLCDVDQVQLVVLLQGLQQTRTPKQKTTTQRFLINKIVLGFGESLKCPSSSLHVLAVCMAFLIQGNIRAHFYLISLQRSMSY